MCYACTVIYIYVWRGRGFIYFILMIKMASVFKLPYVNGGCRGDNLLILLKWLAYEAVLFAFCIIPVILSITF